LEQTITLSHVTETGSSITQVLRYLFSFVNCYSEVTLFL
jgi:hypothetical protein